jgi:hypothetical protein
VKKGGVFKHGMSRTPLYYVWAQMRNRCYRKNTKGWKNYGGRGIKICKRWEESFLNFYTDMAPTYQKGLWLERKNNAKNYTPTNCTWGTIKTQSMNRRTTRWIKTPWGMLTPTDTAVELGIAKNAMFYRINNWVPSRWFEKPNPVKQRRKS